MSRPQCGRSFPSRSPTLRPWIAGPQLRDCEIRRPTWRSFGARRLLSGRKSQAKADRYLPTRISAVLHRGAFLSQAGPRARRGFLTLSITSQISGNLGLTRRRRPLGRPLRSHIWLYDELNAAPYEGRRRGPRATCIERLLARTAGDDRHGCFGSMCVVEDRVRHSSSPCHRRA